MRRSIYFCRSWFHYRGEPRDPITRKEAEAIFNDEKMGEGFVILVGDPTRPTAVISYVVDIEKRKSYAVYFLDSNLRTRLSYSFQQMGDERLFLSHSGEATYSDEGREADESLSEFYNEEGLIRYSRKRRGEDFKETWKDRLKILEYHYEALPMFGEYDSILRVERDLPWPDQQPWRE